MAIVWVRIVILTVRITLSVCPFNRMAHTANSGYSIAWFDAVLQFLDANKPIICTTLIAQ
jgi:hypothetical protein